MSVHVDLPPWRLAAGNGCVPDLSRIDSQEPLRPTGVADKSDRATVASLFDAAPANAFTLPQIQFYEHINFGGASEITSLNWKYVGDWWNDKISSIVVYRGRWRFYQHWHYEGAYWDLGPGQYPWVESANIPNDIISSFKFIGY